jgi:hypothetical protein
VLGVRVRGRTDYLALVLRRERECRCDIRKIDRGCFGVPAPTRRWFENPVVGAIADTSGQFDDFKARFTERLVRLRDALPASIPKLVEKAANAGTKSWEGHFAELAAWDYMASLPLGLEIEVAPPAPQLGLGRYPLDGCLSSCWDLCFDVKALTDVSARVVARVREHVSKRFPDLRFDFEYSLHLPQTGIGLHRDSLVAAIESAVKGGETRVEHRETGVAVRIRRPTRGVTFTQFSYDPYAQANGLRFMPLADAHQLLKGKPNLLVIVVHPWFNMTNSSDVGGTRTTFFRALARRVFCQLTRDRRLLAVEVKGAPEGLTVREAARHVGGLLFVVDHSLTGRERRDHTQVRGVLEGFMFGNPNAYKACDASLLLDQIEANSLGLLSVYEEFRFDNY